jgi:hypothetical protein
VKNQKVAIYPLAVVSTAGFFVCRPPRQKTAVNGIRLAVSRHSGVAGPATDGPGKNGKIRPSKFEQFGYTKFRRLESNLLSIINSPINSS